MNKFSTANSIVQVASISDLMTTTNQGGGGTSGGSSNGTAATGGEASRSTSSGTGNQNVFVMGEFALLDPQLVTTVKSAVGYNWTIPAVHNHMVLEKAKMMFVHWSAQGDLNTITSQIKSVLLMVSSVPNNGS